MGFHRLNREEGIDAIDATVSSKQIEQRRDAAFHALGNQFRRTLLAHLATEQRTIAELVEVFPEEATTLAYHLRALKKARLIETLAGPRRGTAYQVSPNAIADLKRVLTEAQPEPSEDASVKNAPLREE